MATEKLDIMQTLKDGVRYGLKNFVPLLLMVLLYVVTVWIPYLNVGTTIGLYKAIIGIGRGETIDPTSIFAKDNFKNLSGFFLLLGLLYIGIVVATMFMFIPGIVMGIAWGFAIYFFLDKKVSPLKSLQLSYDSTYGNKWRIFAVGLVLSILIGLVCGLLSAIPKVGVVLCIIASIVCTAICVAVEGVMYDFFSKKADNLIEEHHRNHPHGRCCHGEKPVEEVVEEVVEDIEDEVKTEA
jgi:uncharacterized membrane protein